MAKRTSLLSVQNLAVSYGHIQALKKIDLEVMDGEFVVLLGSNGSGKSTLLNALLGKARPSRGSIIFNGRDITRWATERIVASGISIVPEGRGILPLMSVMDNLELGAYHVKHDTTQELQNVFELFPILADRKKQQAGTLSGGQQQMLALGRALMSSPKLLLMDEPSLGLAPIVVSQVYEVISDLQKKGQTILLTEQNARKALKYANRGYVFDLGTSVFNGTSQELSNDPRIRKAYLGGSD
ncbi:MAG TPA: ABC transporter ATP-binding protein [Dehalococcoidales bacterium]